MKIHLESNNASFSKKAFGYVYNEIKDNKSLLLCTATGSSPIGLYKLMQDEFMVNPNLFSELRILKLDEWRGIEMENPATCDFYLKKHLINPLEISDNRYFAFKSNPKDGLEECYRIQQILKKQGPIDLCILGLGLNGHLGFNEPARDLMAECHIAKLSADSKNHKMASGLKDKPSYGFTLGMADILKSKKILLLVNGKNKKAVTQKLLSGKITTELPASFLWLHSDVNCIIEESVLE